MIYDSIVDLIGRTPIVRLQRIVPQGLAHVWVKLESMNPGRSVKDRAAANMLHVAESQGLIRPGASTIVEPTSGNTGIGLAMVCAAKGYACVITMPDNATRERVQMLRAYGAVVHLTPASLRMKGAIDRAKELASEIPDSFIPMQFENRANPDAHRTTTAVEILLQMKQNLDALVLTAGTGGTVTGTGEVLKEHLPDLLIFVVEPMNSPVLSGGTPGPHRIPGTGPGFIPSILNQSIYDEIILVSDDDAEVTARNMAQGEGVLVGTSGGASVWGAIQIAKRLGAGKRVLAIAPDTGERYLSSGLFADD